jgi:hypothetical protein
MHENLYAPLKSRISLLLLTLVLAASSTLAAQARNCSNMTLKGTWANSIHGQLFLPNGSTLLFDGIVKTTYDGEGNFTQVDAVADNGNITPGWRPGSGTYTVNPDCTGTSTIVVPGMPDLHLQFIVSPSGNTSHFVVVDPGFATAGDSERISR